MKYFLVSLHSRPQVLKISYEKYCSILAENGIEDLPGVEDIPGVYTVFAPFPYSSRVKITMLTDDFMLIKWIK